MYLPLSWLQGVVEAQPQSRRPSRPRLGGRAKLAYNPEPSMPASFYRRNLPHLQRENKCHFLTFCTYRRWILPEIAREIVFSCCLHDHQVRYELQAAVVMPDHVHMVFVPLINPEKQETRSLAEIMDALKGASAHMINRKLARKGRVWQEESFDRVLRSSESLGEKIVYILNNPVRKGLVSRPEDYSWLWTATGELRSPAQPGAAGPT